MTKRNRNAPTRFETEMAGVKLADLLADAIQDGGAHMVRAEIMNGQLPVIIVIVAGPVCDVVAPELERMRDAVIADTTRLEQEVDRATPGN